ncbi:MAG: zinc-ribbon domain-containing protein [Coprobacillaceae bacterium]
MYCRKCGSKVNDRAKFCDSCGEKIVIVKQRGDVEKFQAKLASEEQDKQKNISKKEKKQMDLKNPYVIPALGTAIIAFALGIFPWPASWGVGTSLWMRIIILVVALLSSYHSRKARQVNKAYHIRYRYEVQPKYVKVASVLSSLTAVVALFTLVMK